MNEKIQNLIEELAEECAKEQVVLLCAAQKEEKGITEICGGLEDLEDIEACLEVLQKNVATTIFFDFIQSISELADRENEEEKSTTHTFVTDDPNELGNILARILRGEVE